MKKNWKLLPAIASLVLSTLAFPACSARMNAADGAAAKANPEAIAEAAGRNAYFGDLHVHTRNSFDAFIFGTRAGPDEAYRFAKGETIKGITGDIVIDGPPLDFLAVTDHGEYLGIVPALANPESPLSKTAFAQSVFGPKADNPLQSFSRIGMSFVLGTPIDEIYDRATIDTVWAATVAAAEEHNEPGKFTTFAGYEFTAMVPVDPVPGQAPAAYNLHRNVIFRGAAPDRIFTTLDSINPEDLWTWMDGQRAEGREVLSIPHNSNASGGMMFAQETYKGQPLTAAISALRARNEPLMEITQIKGTSETHPALSPNDEWAGFEQYEFLIGSSVRYEPVQGSNARDMLTRGLLLEESRGFSPYRLGFVGSSDTHIAAVSMVEEDFLGKTGEDAQGPAFRMSIPPNGRKTWGEAAKGSADGARVRALNASQYSAAGLAGVWAESNTRESIHDALRRKETFATSGPRMKVRSFAGFGFDEKLMRAPDAVMRAYKDGVPMGGNLAADGRAPVIFAWAMRDPQSQPLERMQIIKVSILNGVPSESVIDVTCAGGVKPDAATSRCPASTATLNTANCAVTPGNAANELKAVWKDPDYNPAERAAYYVRVLEIPACRWSTWDAVRNGTPPNPDLPVSVQERAWTSPIWVGPRPE